MPITFGENCYNCNTYSTICIEEENIAPNQYAVYTFTCPNCNQQNETISGSLRGYGENLTKCDEGNVPGKRKA